MFHATMGSMYKLNRHTFFGEPSRGRDPVPTSTADCKPDPDRHESKDRRRSTSVHAKIHPMGDPPPATTRRRSPSRHRSQSRRRSSSQSRRRSSSQHHSNRGSNNNLNNSRPSVPRNDSRYSTPFRGHDPSSHDKERTLRHYVQSLGLPQTLSSTIMKIYDSCASRLWLIENSQYMETRDSHLMKITCGPGRTGSGGSGGSGGGSAGNIERIDQQSGVSRWSELAECVGFHAKMANRCWIPTKFWLVNDPGPEVGNRCFSVGWGAPEELEADLKQAKHIMTNVRLDSPINPLAKQIRRMEQGIAPRAARLEAKGKFISVVICTQGMPTDEAGRVGSAAAVKEFTHALHSLSKLPVKLIFRLCTDEDQVRDLYNTFDSKLGSCDVLDDYWGEAMEVYLHNPWITYGIGLHRLREAGLATDLMDDLDEKPLSLDDIHQFCKDLFVGNKRGVELPHPRNWRRFMSSLEQLMRNERLQWNPVKKTLTPWIDLEKLQAMHGPRSQAQRRASAPNPGMRGRWSHAEPNERRNNSWNQSRSSPPSPPTGRTREPPAVSATDPSDQGADLDQVLQRWSHQPPNWRLMYPLEVLLVQVPNTFPPNNPHVEPHEYFSKWKEFSKEAFTGSGDELNELLKRAVRKAKFFLHPDKLPTDLTESQSKLIRYIWDTIAEQEDKYLN